MVKSARIYVRATVAEQAVFRAVAEKLGQTDNVSAMIRFLVFEKARELGLEKPPPKRRK